MLTSGFFLSLASDRFGTLTLQVATEVSMNFFNVFSLFMWILYGLGVLVYVGKLYSELISLSRILTC